MTTRISTTLIGSASKVGHAAQHNYLGLGLLALGRNIADYGAVAGEADSSTSIQDAIDTCEAAGGGIVRVPPGTYNCNVTLKEGVYLVGAGRGYLPGSVNTARFVAAGAGAVIDTPVGRTNSCGVIGINIVGNGDGATASIGVRFRDVAVGYIKNLHVNSTNDQALLVENPSVACVFEDVQVTNALLNRTRSALEGAIEIGGTDHMGNRLESTTSGSIEGDVSSASLYCAAFVLRDTNSFYSVLVGEISDIGIAVLGNLNRFSNCRADLNYGHGWYVDGDSNLFATCIGMNNSQGTTNTYDNWILTSSSGRNLTAACSSQSSSTKRVRYGFNDQASSTTQKNQHSNPDSSGATTRQYIGAASSGSAWHFPSGATKTLTANATTHDVTGYGQFLTANSNPTTITALTGGVPGQIIYMYCNDSNTTIEHNGSGFTLFGGGNRKLRSGIWYEFICANGTLWRENSPAPLGVTADVGNAAKSLTARTSEETQIWNTPLTADRAVTLGTFGAYAGAQFRIVRTAAATGAFNLNVGSGPLKALAAGQWCEVTYSGAAWVLTAFGSL